MVRVPGLRHRHAAAVLREDIGAAVDQQDHGFLVARALAVSLPPGEHVQAGPSPHVPRGHAGAAVQEERDGAGGDFA